MSNILPGEQGENANVDKEPIAYQKPGRKRRMNTSQLLPRASKEMQTTPKQYELLHSSFEDIFQWQSSEVSLPLRLCFAIYRLYLYSLKISFLKSMKNLGNMSINYPQTK